MGVWLTALIAFLVGFLPGVTLFPWLASPFGPGLWMLAEPFARIHLTLSQFIRGHGVLVKRRSGEYEFGTYHPDRGIVELSDASLEVDPEDVAWGLFGKQPLGVTWEPGTELHELIRQATAGDGGEPVEERGDAGDGLPVDVAAAHRLLEGVNDADVITRTEENAEAEYGGAADSLSGLTMGVLVGVMLVLGSLTTFFML